MVERRRHRRAWEAACERRWSSGDVVGRVTPLGRSTPATALAARSHFSPSVQCARPCAGGRQWDGVASGSRSVHRTRVGRHRPLAETRGQKVLWRRRRCTGAWSCKAQFAVTVQRTRMITASICGTPCWWPCCQFFQNMLFYFGLFSSFHGNVRCLLFNAAFRAFYCTLMYSPWLAGFKCPIGHQGLKKSSLTDSEIAMSLNFNNFAGTWPELPYISLSRPSRHPEPGHVPKSNLLWTTVDDQILKAMPSSSTNLIEKNTLDSAAAWKIRPDLHAKSRYGMFPKITLPRRSAHSRCVNCTYPWCSYLEIVTSFQRTPPVSQTTPQRKPTRSARSKYQNRCPLIVPTMFWEVSLGLTFENICGHHFWHFKNHNGHHKCVHHFQYDSCPRFMCVSVGRSREMCGAVSGALRGVS